ncbi:hypothetical protein GW17_00022934 [Ensete ventricosum]|nr:hypothetical protein GW17_00022934 [Ensete ventricosum]
MYREFCERTADENAIRPMKIGRRMWKDEIACVGVSVGSTDPKRKICAANFAVRCLAVWVPDPSWTALYTVVDPAGGLPSESVPIYLHRDRSIDQSEPYVSFGSTRWGVVETGAPLSSSHKIFALFYGVPTEAVGSLPADQGRNSGVEDDGIACGGSARLSPPRQAAEMRPLTRVVPIQCHALPWVLLHASAIYRVFQLCKVGGVLQARFSWVSLLLRDSGTLPHPGPAIMYGELHHCLVLFNSPYRERRRRSKGQYATPRALACSCIDVCFRTFGRTPHLLGSLLHGLDNSKKSL